jgi:ArsR family transcriptional regulator
MASHGELAELFGLLGDGTRLRIVMLLSQGPRNVSSLCETMRLPQPTVSHHLALLREAGVISNRREGKQVFYSLNGSADGVDHTFEISANQYRIRVESIKADVKLR